MAAFQRSARDPTLRRNTKEAMMEAYSNCKFDVNLCGWSSDRIKEGKWTVNGSVAQLQWISSWGNAKAWMTSPKLCETSSETACLRMRYKINRSRKLYIERCNHSCETLWSTDKGTEDQWQAVNVSIDTSGSFTIRITGEKSFYHRGPQIYVDDVTYTNTPCNQTRNTRSLNGTTTTSNGPDSSTRPSLSGNGTGITPTTQGPTQEAALEVESSHDAVDNAVTTGIAAAVVAIAMVIAAVAVVARYYINRGCCNRSLLRKKPSIPKYNDKNPPITASNQLYNIVGEYSVHNCDQCSRWSPTSKL
ncbi:uncharacterized protein LOC112558824 [Pomacea canaliculata]|uniref:uncharacterized protein LOC112558824 n=1 Tax=Pomacea canaliculata TaxID=400727 RepID=UPI000D72FCFB|nr:uncharacterized protein LOC112558824 [Pomacea canaliculata]